jgi:hypothetical protein
LGPQAAGWRRFVELATFGSAPGYGPLADDEVVLADDNGDEHVFHFEAFHNRHDTLGLFVYRRAVAKRVFCPGDDCCRGKEILNRMEQVGCRNSQGACQFSTHNVNMSQFSTEMNGFRPADRL